MKKHIIGLDIGRRWTKAVRVQARRMAVEAVLFFPTPHQDEKGESVDWPKLMGEINRQWGLRQLQKSALGITLPAEDFQVFVVEVPRMKPAEMQTAAVAEAKRRMVSAPGPDAVFQCRVLEERDTPKGRFADVLVIKTERGTVAQALAGCQSVVGVEPQSLAPLSLSLEHIIPEPKKEAVIIVDIGAVATTMAIFHGGALFFHRVVQFGVRDIIQILQRDLVIDSTDEIEEWVKNKGVPPVDLEEPDREKRLRLVEQLRDQRRRLKTDGGTLELTDRDVRVAFEPVLDRLTLEIRRTAAFYKEQSRGGRVQRFYFIGGGAAIPRLVGQLNRSIGGECAVFDLSAQMPAEAAASLDPKTAEIGVVWVGAWAAAWQTKAVMSGSPVIDFIPQEIRKKRVWLLYRSAAAFGGMVVLTMLVFLCLRVYWDIRKVQNTKQALERQLTANRNIVSEIERLKQEKQLLSEKSKWLRMVASRRIPAAALLGLLAQSIPEHVVVKSITLAEAGDEGYTLSIEAACECDYEQSVAAASALQQGVEHLPGVVGVTVKKPVLEEVVPQLDDEGRLHLTTRKKREFSVQVKLAP